MDLGYKCNLSYTLTKPDKKNFSTFSTAPRKVTSTRISPFKFFEEECKYCEIISTVAMTIGYSN